MIAYQHAAETVLRNPYFCHQLVGDLVVCITDDLPRVGGLDLGGVKTDLVCSVNPRKWRLAVALFTMLFAQSYSFSILIT